MTTPPAGRPYGELCFATGSHPFDTAMARANYPVAILTTRVGEQRAGCLVGFTTQVSIQPPRFLACVSKANFTYRVATSADHLAIHLVDPDHLALARLFGAKSGDQVNKFGRCDWCDGPYGLPILTDAAAWFAGPVVHRVDLGDHVGFTLEPDTGAAADDDTAADPIRYRAVSDITPGHPTP